MKATKDVIVCEAKHSFDIRRPLPELMEDVNDFIISSIRSWSLEAPYSDASKDELEFDEPKKPVNVRLLLDFVS